MIFAVFIVDSSRYSSLVFDNTAKPLAASSATKPKGKADRFLHFEALKLYLVEIDCSKPKAPVQVDKLVAHDIIFTN
jgi:hypothetical protein